MASRLRVLVSQRLLLFRDASVVIAVDRTAKADGGLQVIKDSHKCGLIEHRHFGTQTGTDPKRVDLLLENLEHVYYEMGQGDTLFSHSNLRHSSDANDSDEPHWLLICCYNTRYNPCRDLSGRSSHQHMEKWLNDQIVDIGSKQ